jgi:hypothetical protein
VQILHRRNLVKTTDSNDPQKKGGGPANRDPITKKPGAHPIGVAGGAAPTGAAGAAIGGAVGGPVGAVVGAAVGAIAGGLAGKGVAERINPTVEDGYWRGEYANRPYVTKGATYETYQPAYRYGWESRVMHDGRAYDEVEPELERGWSSARGNSTLEWRDAKPAVRDAWHRIEGAIPGDADKDGF